MPDFVKVVVVDTQYESNQTMLQGALNRQSIGMMSGLAMVGTLNATIGHMLMIEDRKLMMAESLDNSNLRIISAQEHYNMVVQRFGAGSEQAQISHNQLTIAHNMHEKMLQREAMLNNYEYMAYIPAALAIINILMTIFAAKGAARIAADVATAGAAEAGFQAEDPGGVQEDAMVQMAPQWAGLMAGGPAMYHAGGSIPSTGKYILEKGETVGTPDGRTRPTKNVQIVIPGGLSPKQAARYILARMKDLK